MKIKKSKSENNKNISISAKAIKNNRWKTRKNKLLNSYVLNKINLLLFLFFFYLCLTIFHIGCPIKYFAGISCAGCGMTRAVHSALLFRFSEAFHYHPLFPLIPVMVLLFLFEDKLKPKQIKFAWIIIVSLFLLTYVIRLFIMKNDIITIDFNSSIVLKLLHIRV